MMSKVEIIFVNSFQKLYRFGCRMHFHVKFRCLEGIDGFLEFNLIYRSTVRGVSTDHVINKTYILPLEPQLYYLELVGEPLDRRILSVPLVPQGMVIVSAAYNGMEFKQYHFACKHFLGTPNYDNGSNWDNLVCHIHVPSPRIFHYTIDWNRRPSRFSMVLDKDDPVNKFNQEMPHSGSIGEKEYINCNGKIIVKFPNGESVPITSKKPDLSNDKELSTIDVVEVPTAPAEIEYLPAAQVENLLSIPVAQRSRQPVRFVN